MIEVTADSNIYISALAFGGTPLRFLEQARRGMISLAISDWIIGEVDRVLRTKFLWDVVRLTDALNEIADFTTKVHPTQTLTVIKEDPADDRVLECAVAANSKFLVSGDGDLLRLGRYQDIQILRVADFMRLVAPS